MSEPRVTTAGHFEVRFHSLFQRGRGLAFPCDAEGRVDLAVLPQAAKLNYLAACDRVGRDFASPCVLAQPRHH